MDELVELRAVVDATPSVAAAWVLGSMARGDAREDSDLDVAVLLDLSARLEAASGRRVDLVVLGLRDPILAHRVLSEGLLLVDRSPHRRIDFTSDVLARHLDWEPRFRAAAARSRRRIGPGRGSSVVDPRGPLGQGGLRPGSPAGALGHPPLEPMRGPGRSAQPARSVRERGRSALPARSGRSTPSGAPRARSAGDSGHLGRSAAPS